MHLRKGHFSLEINHYFGSDTIRAKEARIELKEGTVVFECTLFPVDQNQESDAHDRKEKEFSDVEFFSLLDAYIRKNFSLFLKNHKDEIESWRLDLHYKGTNSFPCTIQPLEPDGIISMSESLSSRTYQLRVALPRYSPRIPSTFPEK